MHPQPGNLYSFASIEENKIIIYDMVKRYKEMTSAGGEMSHCAAIVAHDFFQLTISQWKGPKGGEYFAAILAVMVVNKMWRGY
jgi:hypothetical protein